MTFLKMMMIGSLGLNLYATALTDETVTFKGTPVHLSGTKVSVGDMAPIATVVDRDLNELKIGEKMLKTQVIVMVPSLDTPVCNLEARTFNTEMAKRPEVQMVTVSMDLPFAGKRYCAAHGVDNILVTSDFRYHQAAEAYGMLLDDGPFKGLFARAIFIVKEGQVIYRQLVPEITQEPDYKAVYRVLDAQ